MKKILIALLLVALLTVVGIVGYNFILRGDTEVIGSGDAGLEDIRPRNMLITEITDTGFVVEWEVKKEVSGYIRYGDTSNSMSLIAQDMQGAVPSRNHVVRVTGLAPGKKYYFWVMSDEIAFGRNSRALEVLTQTR
jgi:hypothetical protein